MWGVVTDPPQLDLRRFQRDFAALASDIDLIDQSARFRCLVGSEHLRQAPVHRWFTYKEGFSPLLLSAVIDALGLDAPLRVADAFGGVATTALSGLGDGRVEEVRSLEYSPWARFVGQTKLAWPWLDPRRLRRLVPHALEYALDPTLPLPALSSFSNPRVFHHSTVTALLSARAHLRGLNGVRPVERDFFLLGLAAVIEDLSRVMKDGRALRVRGERKRRRASLVEGEPPTSVGRVRWFLERQWGAMIDDLDMLVTLRELACQTPAAHVRGDARDLHTARLPGGDQAFPGGWAQLSCFSPPYLNCIDYSELYKLELWLMEHIASQEEFRQTRLGTLRSHPSVQFEPRHSFANLSNEPVVQLVGELSEWLCRHGARRDVGPVVQAYFEDMSEVWFEQHRLLSTDGVAVCVVANSTFARRERQADGSRSELWRLPLMTDVLLAHLARLAGFEHVEIWNARALRPRNVRGGDARESLVVARKRIP